MFVIWAVVGTLNIFACRHFFGRRWVAAAVVVSNCFDKMGALVSSGCCILLGSL